MPKVKKLVRKRRSVHDNLISNYVSLFLYNIKTTVSNEVYWKVDEKIDTSVYLFITPLADFVLEELKAWKKEQK